MYCNTRKKSKYVPVHSIGDWQIVATFGEELEKILFTSTFEYLQKNSLF